MKISVIIPTLNEELSLPFLLLKKSFFSALWLSFVAKEEEEEEINCNHLPVADDIMTFLKHGVVDYTIMTSGKNNNFSRTVV